jgi:hypothetical protein
LELSDFMLIRRRALAFASLAALLVSSSVLAQPRPAAPDSREQARKLSNDEKKEFQAITGLLSSGQPPANTLSLAWGGSDLLKAQGNKEYVPFSVTFDPSKLTGGTVSIYWRVVSTDATPVPEPAPAKKDDKKDDKKAPAAVYAYENLHTITVPAGQTTPVRVSRSFVVAAGSYDVFVVVKEPDSKKKGDPPAKTGMVKQSIAVPDLWNGELNTSSVIVAERIDPLPVALTPAQQEERPYALGNMEIVPAAGNRFTKKNELSVFLLIYNARVDAANAPDVTVEYNFYTVQNGAEKFFNRTNPQSLNAQTLPPGFDPAAGMTNGQTVPLASFPEGDYRLEIKVTDKQASKSITRDVKFAVAGS